jgi:hypothetical protein
VGWQRHLRRVQRGGPGGLGRGAASWRGLHVSNKLYEDSLKLTINKNLSDIRVLLLWAEEAVEVREKIQHAEQALTYLADIVETLRGMEK